MVTIKDVSKRSGYSITTVSKALNNYSDISDSTKKKILDLCEEMGYVPNLSARSLITQKSYTIGIIFEEITGVGLQHPLFSKILESFKNTVEAQGFDIMFLSNRMGSKNGSYLEHSKRKQVEGILALCGEFNSDEMVALYKSDIPTIVIDFEIDSVSNITSNNGQGVEQAVKYFKQLGHTKIANIHGGMYLYIGEVRKIAFEKAMKKYGLEVREEYHVNGEFFSKENGYEAMKKLLSLEEPPTAIFCASDMMAIGAMQAIKEAGKSVPEDFSLIGFDGIDVGQLISPRLTTIRQNSRKMGQIAGNSILQMINDKNKRRITETITVDTYLINGETTQVLTEKAKSA
jgi:LacI family transcriptional regulator